MLVQGAVNPSHIIRMMLEKEYAFSLHYPLDQEVRIAHRKGVWWVVQLRARAVHDFFIVDDTDQILEAPNPLTRGLIEAKTELLSQDTDNTRESPARIIEAVLKIWAGDPQTISEISILQPGRNASVNEVTGNFDLNPRPEEFKK